MTRRRAAKVRPAVWVDWTPEIAALCEPYRPLLGDMPDPRRVRVFFGERHHTLVAVFSNADGLTARIKIKQRVGA